MQYRTQANFSQPAAPDDDKIKIKFAGKSYLFDKQSSQLESLYCYTWQDSVWSE